MNDRVRVLAAIELFSPHFSGAGYRFRRYGPMLADHGVDLEVLSGARPSTLIDDATLQRWRQARVGSIVERSTVDSIPVSRVRLPFPDERGLLRPAEVLNSAALLRCMGRARPDVLQITSIDRRQSPLILANRLRVPTLVAWTMISARTADQMPRWSRPLWRAPFDAATEVVVNGAAMGELLTEVGVRRPINVLPNGVDLTHHRPATPSEYADLRAEFGLTAAPVLVTLGRMNKRKQHHLLLEAFAALSRERPELQLLIVGPTDTSPYGQSLRALAKQCRGTVRWVGQQTDVRPYLRCADLFVFTSAQEGLPNAILEAMATGLPVVTSRFRGFGADLGVPGQTLVALPDGGTQTLPQTLAELIDAPEERTRLGRNARAFVERSHSLEQAVAGYAALYHRLAKR